MTRIVIITYQEKEMSNNNAKSKRKETTAGVMVAARQPEMCDVCVVMRASNCRQCPQDREYRPPDKDQRNNVVNKIM